VKAEESSHANGNSRLPTTIPLEMNWKAFTGVGVAFAILLYGTVLVFMAFDRDSHSASDTIRPFVITMGPVWLLSLAAAYVLFRRSPS